MASSLEGNKIFAAILTAGIIASAAGVFSRILYSPHELEENVLHVDVAAVEGGGAAPEEAVEPIAVRLASADPAKGQTAVKVCTSCHSFEQGGPNKVGPNLYHVVGEPIGEGRGGYSFSTALAEKEGEWTFENLDGFIAAPRQWAPGTKMSFAGISNPGQRADVIAYLRSLSDNPVPLPEAPAGGGEQPAAEGGGQPPTEGGGQPEQAPVQPEQSPAQSLPPG
jgi:cytochrome c